MSAFSEIYFLVCFHCTYFLLFDCRVLLMQNYCVCTCVAAPAWKIYSTKIEYRSKDTVGNRLLGTNGCLLLGQNTTKPKQFYGSRKISLVILGCPFIKKIKMSCMTTFLKTIDSISLNKPRSYFHLPKNNLNHHGANNRTHNAFFLLHEKNQGRSRETFILACFWDILHYSPIKIKEAGVCRGWEGSSPMAETTGTDL